jgi:hypothetical protein
MDETQTLAAQALRELLDPDRDDWDVGARFHVGTGA